MKSRRCKICKRVFEVKSNYHRFCDFECAMVDVQNKRDKKIKDKNKKWDQERRPYTHSKEYKKQLQDSINLLARNIDAYFGFNCIDCNKPLIKQVHGAHFHNVGGNENIRYNLHNIHSAKSNCNKYSSEHKVGYRKGIIERYGDVYLEYIDFEMGRKYSYLGLSELEIVEKLSIVRKLNREFYTFKLQDGKQARDMFNKLIGIYK